MVPPALHVAEIIRDPSSDFAEVPIENDSTSKCNISTTGEPTVSTKRDEEHENGNTSPPTHWDKHVERFAFLPTFLSY